MASLVSPGVSVTVTNESFFIPAGAATVPLYIIATADEKLQPAGIAAAAGTYEHNTVRTVTSLLQSTQLYGIPSFLVDSSGNPQHGDARNEYGLYAMNQYLGVGSMAYALRANVNLNDNFTSIQTMWDTTMSQSAYVLTNLASSYINSYNTAGGYLPTQQSDIVSFGVPVAGSNMTVGNYTNVSLSGGTGSGAVANIVVSNLTSGKSTIAVVANPAVVGPTVVGIAAGDYTIDVNVDGAGLVEHIITATGTDTVSSIAALMQVAVGMPVTVVGNAFVFTSPTSGTMSSVLVSLPAAAGVDLISAISTSLVASSVTNTAVSGITGVSSVMLVSGGIGYALSDVLTANVASVGNTGSGFSVTVTGITPNSYKTSLTISELTSLMITATQPVFAMYSFRNSYADFFNDHTTLPLAVFANGYSNAPVGTGYLGVAGLLANWATNFLGSMPPHTGWTPTEAGNTLLNASDSFKFTNNFLSQTALGSNDAARRVAIVTALRAVVNSNTDIRSEAYEYNLILCPGYPELAQAMTNLSIDIQEEAMVVADTPFDATPDSVVAWAATTARTTSSNTTYYYPHGLASNLDGATVFVASSGTAVATMAYSDNVSNVWFAPAGTRRGVVSSLLDVGYVSGTLGAPTTFTPVALNLGQRNNLYKYFTNINPIVFFPGRGIIVWGQKTSAPDASALDRINVVRLMMYIKRALRKNTMSFIFEPNDKLTQDNLKAMVDGFLSNLITARGLYDFASVCDSSNNTPTRIDNNELHIDIALKPVKAAEFLYIPIRIVATGAPLAKG
jgi:hypothetical protein